MPITYRWEKSRPHAWQGYWRPSSLKIDIHLPVFGVKFVRIVCHQSMKQIPDIMISYGKKILSLEICFIISNILWSFLEWRVCEKCFQLIYIVGSILFVCTEYLILSSLCSFCSSIDSLLWLPISISVLVWIQILWFQIYG